MRGFIFGGLMASTVWVFLTLDGSAKINQAWANYRQTEMIATAKELAKERESAFNSSYRPNHGCGNPSSELKRLECGNQMEMARSSFYARWNHANADRFPK